MSFINQIKKKGKVLLHCRVDLDTSKIRSDISVYRYGIGSGDFKAINISISRKRSQFDFFSKSYKVDKINLHVSGLHNIENSTAAISVVSFFKVPFHLIRNSMESYLGVKRRFEYIIRVKDLIYVDDYAHHPYRNIIVFKFFKGDISQKRDYK